MLRERFAQDMRLAGYAARTIDAYVAAVARLVAFAGTTPARIKDEDLRRYFLHLTCERHLGRSAVTIALCAAKLFFERTLGRFWPTLALARPPRGNHLPVVLAREEVHRVLVAVDRQVMFACLATIYSCGLRLTEGRTLTPAQVDSARGVLHVTGKGARNGEGQLGTGIVRRAPQSGSVAASLHRREPLQPPRRPFLRNRLNAHTPPRHWLRRRRRRFNSGLSRG